MFVRSLSRYNQRVSARADDLIKWVNLQEAQHEEQTDERKQPEIKLPKHLPLVDVVCSLLDIRHGREDVFSGRMLLVVVKRHGFKLECDERLKEAAKWEIADVRQGGWCRLCSSISVEDTCVSCLLHVSCG